MDFGDLLSLYRQVRLLSVTGHGAPIL